MKNWQAIITSEAEKDLEKLDSSIRKRVLEKLKWMRENFSQIIPTPLSDKWKGFFKLRVGDWRIIYKIDNKNELIVIYRIEHRSKVYKIKK